MDPLLVGTVAILVLIFLFALGIHIGLALMLVGFVGLVVVKGNVAVGLGIFTATPYYSVAQYAFTIVPLFILMGLFALHGGISRDAFATARNWLGWIPGGLSIATIWACVGFGATSGSYLAAATVFTKVSLPEMKKAGYEVKSACGIIGTASVIAMLIPPSLFFVIYAMMAEQSVGELLIAGVLPGLVLAMCLSAAVLILAILNPRLAPVIATKVSWRERLASLRGLWPILVMILVVLGGIYTGLFTPTEAGATGALGAFIIALARRGLNWDKLKTALVETAEFTAMLFFILIGATILGRFLAISGFSAELAGVIVGLDMPLIVIVTGLMFVYLLLGCIMGPIEIMAITIPIVFPPLMGMGLDPIWFGVLVVLATSIGSITPPFGITVFTVKAAAGPDVTIEDVFRGSFPFLIGMLVALGFLVAFPQISVFLPNTMFGR